MKILQANFVTVSGDLQDRATAKIQKKILLPVFSELQDQPMSRYGNQYSPARQSTCAHLPGFPHKLHDVLEDFVRGFWYG